jgi:hypothetical protein
VPWWHPFGVGLHQQRKIGLEVRIKESAGGLESLLLSEALLPTPLVGGLLDGRPTKNGWYLFFSQVDKEISSESESQRYSQAWHRSFQREEGLKAARGRLKQSAMQSVRWRTTNRMLLLLLLTIQGWFGTQTKSHH